MTLLKELVLAAGVAERQQSWSVVMQNWSTLASDQQYEAPLRAAMLKPAVPGSDESLYELLLRHATKAPHSGVRRAACYLLACGFQGNLALQRSVVADAPHKSSCAFRWRNWWVLAVPRSTRRSWNLRRHRLALDQRYDLEMVGQSPGEPQRVHAVPREALTAVGGEAPELSSSPDAPADWFLAGDAETETAEVDDVVALLDVQMPMVLHATNENATVLALAHPAPPLPKFDMRPAHVSGALSRARDCWANSKVPASAARNRLIDLTGGVDEFGLEHVRTFFRNELRVPRKKLSDAAIVIVFEAAGKEKGRTGVSSNALMQVLEGASELPPHLHARPKLSAFDDTEPARVPADTFDERFNADVSF